MSSIQNGHHPLALRTLWLYDGLLVGDEGRNVYYYSVELMSKQQVDIHGWTGAMTLMAKISVHSQQICGLAWSPDGEFFATDANDNACCLFDSADILTPPDTTQDASAVYRSPFQSFLEALVCQTLLPGREPHLILWLSLLMVGSPSNGLGSFPAKMAHCS